MFQVHQSKKSTKFSCPICNAKQSVIKIWSKGSANECRKITQRLNLKCQGADEDTVDRELMVIEDENYQERVGEAAASGHALDMATSQPSTPTLLADAICNKLQATADSPLMPIDYSLKFESDNKDIGDVEMVAEQPDSPKAKRTKYDLF